MTAPYPPPLSDLAVGFGNPNVFYFSQFAGLVAIACTIISTYAVVTMIAVTEYRKRRGLPIPASDV